MKVMSSTVNSGTCETWHGAYNKDVLEQRYAVTGNKVATREYEKAKEYSDYRNFFGHKFVKKV